jgi:hypothetical protein
MESRNPFSRLKKRVKNRLTGKKADSDKPGDDDGGTRREPTDPLPQQEQHMVADSSRRGEGDRYDAGGNQVRLADRPLRPDEPVLSPADESGEPRATADGSKSNWKSTASATAKLLLRGVRDTADAFGPLKSVAGGLCFILENCEVRLSSSTIHGAYICPREQRRTRMQ